MPHRASANCLHLTAFDFTPGPLRLCVVLPVANQGRADDHSPDGELHFRQSARRLLALHQRKWLSLEPIVEQLQPLQLRLLVAQSRWIKAVPQPLDAVYICIADAKPLAGDFRTNVSAVSTSTECLLLACL